MSPHQLLFLHFRSLPSQIKLRWSRCTSYCFRRKICLVCSWGSQVTDAAEARHSKGTAPSLALRAATFAGRSVGQSRGSIPKAQLQERSSQDSAWQDEGKHAPALRLLCEKAAGLHHYVLTCKHKAWVSFTLLDYFLLIFKPELTHLLPERWVIHLPHNSHNTKL